MVHSISIRIATAIAALTAGSAVAAQAQPAAKPIVIKISDKVFANPTSRLCLPKGQVGKKGDKSVPKAMCHTRDEWEAMGVTFKQR